MQHNPPPIQQRRVGSQRLLTGRDRRAALILTTLTVLCVAGFVFGPRALTGSGPTHGHSLSTATSRAFTTYWQSGQRGYPTGLADLVAYWRRYHLVKAVFALALTILLCWLALILWRSLQRAGQLRPVATAAGVVSASTATALAFGSVLVVIANIQGMFAPFSSLVSLLPVGHGNAALDTADSQIRHDLTTAEARRHAPAPLSAILEDFARYHAAVAVLAAALAVILLALGVLIWRRTPTTDTAAARTKVMPRLLSAALTVLAIIALVICAANTATALNPAPALNVFFGG